MRELREYIKEFLLPIYKFIIEFFNLPKTKFYRYFVKFIWKLEADPIRTGAILTMIITQLLIWHWVFDFNLIQDTVLIALSVMIWDFINKLIINMKSL